MVNQASPHEGNGFEPAMWMLRKPGHLRAVVHAPTVFACKVGSHLPALKRSRRAELLVSLWVSIFVMRAEQEWVDSWPLWAK